MKIDKYVPGTLLRRCFDYWANGELQTGSELFFLVIDKPKVYPIWHGSQCWWQARLPLYDLRYRSRRELFGIEKYSPEGAEEALGEALERSFEICQHD